jgi:general secretion pathway protein E
VTPDFTAWGHAGALRHRAVPARDELGRLWLLADHAIDALLLQAVEAQAREPVRWRRCDAQQVQDWLAEGERDFRALDAVAADDQASEAGTTPELNPGRMADESSPAVRLLDAVLYDALQDGASDVHVETHAGGAQVRLRVDGVLLPMRQVEGSAQAEQMVSRLKVMAELDIGERRLPQDGRFKLRVSGREVDFRLSIMPTTHGEDAVVRVLDRARVQQPGGQLTLAALGYEPPLREAVLAVARRPHGMLLVTGPTGSGKTTTLYATITETHTGFEKTITIEDPVEYQLPGVVQIPVNDRKGLGFARGLRSILRHDPDKIMVGEMRDAETAQIAIQAALTGHQVFATVHANNVFDVIGRLSTMGVDPYNLVSALNGVVAQRLLRIICPDCSAPETPDAGRIEASSLPADLSGWNFRKGIGCAHCRGTGYKGRHAIAQTLAMDVGLRSLIAERASPAVLREAAHARGLRTLRDAALELVAAGQTTLEEANRVTAVEE